MTGCSVLNDLFNTSSRYEGSCREFVDCVVLKMLASAVQWFVKKQRKGPFSTENKSENTGNVSFENNNSNCYRPGDSKRLNIQSLFFKVIKVEPLTKIISKGTVLDACPVSSDSAGLFSAGLPAKSAAEPPSF